MKKKVSVVLCYVVIAVLLMVGCAVPATEVSDTETSPSAEDTVSTGPNEPDGKQITIGLTAKDLAIPAYTAITGILQRKCEENGVQLTAVSANGDPAKQASQIENFVQSDVDTIIVMEAVEQSAAITPVQDAVAAGVPVIGYGLAIEGNTTDLVCPNYDIGYASGEQAAEWMKENYDGKGKIGLLHLSLTSQGGIDRYNGAKDAIAKLLPDVEIAVEQFAQTIEDGVKVTESMIQANSDIVAIVSSSGGGAVGAAEALIGLGKNDGKIGVFSLDTTPDVLSAVKSNKNPIVATVCVGSDSFMANKLYEMSMLIIDNKPFELHYLSELEKLDSANVDEFIAREGITLD